MVRRSFWPFQADRRGDVRAHAAKVIAITARHWQVSR